MKFQGTKNYVATQDLMLSVNAAITLKRPLLVKGLQALFHRAQIEEQFALRLGRCDLKISLYPVCSMDSLL